MVKLSIGLPVFNGEKYIKEALNSILNQTYQDFELIILDNASTDQTPQICREYASLDNRIRYYRNKKKLGASANHNKVFKLSRAKFFKWAAHDDVFDPDFILRCVGVLERDSSIVLCHSKTGCIDECGKLVGHYNYKARIDSQKTHERFGDLISEQYDSWVLLFGVIRSSSLERTSLFGPFIGSDRNLLAELSLIGRMYEFPKYLFFRRSHPQAYTERKFQNFQEELKWWTSVGRTNFPYVKICINYLKSVRSAPLKFSERLLCYAEIVKWFLKEGWIFMCINIGMNLLGGSRIGFTLSPFINRIYPGARSN